jgi:serine/threonine protein kinase/formylglycine-generating enzyme required for sulfatase activity
MGAVYRVWDLKRNVPLAMKVLHAELAEDPTVFKRFQREARALQKLIHPNIVPFYGLYQTLDFAFLMERYIDGPSLKDILRHQQGKPLPIEEALIYLKALGAALGYAHANGVIHCDVKPGNVMIDRGGNIYLTDFGIARHAESTTTTMAGAGTPHYMAPEQIRGDTVTSATDVYALGVVLFEMLTGQRPFKGTESGTEKGGATVAERVRYAHQHLPPPDPHSVNPEIPEGLAQVALRALEKEPARRYQSTQEMLAAACAASGIAEETVPERIAPSQLPPEVKPYAAVQAPSVETPSVPKPSINRLGNRLRSRAGLMVALFAIVAVVFTVALLSGRKTTTNPPGSEENVYPAQSTGPSLLQASPSLPSAMQAAPRTPSPITPATAPKTDAEALAEEGLIAFHTAPCPCQIYLTKPDGSQVWSLPGQPSNAAVPSFSPDGSSLAFEAKVGGSWQIFTMTLDGRDLTQLTFTGGNYDAVWAPTGERILFTSNRDGNPELYLINTDGTGERRLTFDEGDDDDASWAPDGRRVVFESEKDGNYDLYALDVDSGLLARLTTFEGYDSMPAWSPDGSTIAFERDRNGTGAEYALFLIPAPDANGSVPPHELRQITDWGEVRWRPAWSGDGRFIAFNSDEGGSVEVWVTSLDGNFKAQITDLGNVYAPACARLTPTPTATFAPTSTTPHDEKVNPKDNANIIHIPEGDFLMGSDPNHDPYFWGAESPEHQVYLDGYWIYLTEVTTGMYQVCVQEKACPRPENNRSRSRPEYFGNILYDDYPVINVSWQAAQSYCQWAGGRLPTEAEWEKAARGTDGRLFPWGNASLTGNLANFCDTGCPEDEVEYSLDDGFRDTAPVGSFPDGSSPYGLLDMAGNVLEWIHDWYQIGYQDAPQTNPIGPSTGSRHPIRGGSWGSGRAGLRTVARASLKPDNALDNVGFRCVIKDQ